MLKDGDGPTDRTDPANPGGSSGLAGISGSTADNKKGDEALFDSKATYEDVLEMAQKLDKVFRITQS